MKLNQLMAKNLNDVHFGGNWTNVNYQHVLSDIEWRQATHRVQGMHSIAELTYHVSYYVAAVLAVARGNDLDANDKFSFDHPPIESSHAWNGLKQQLFADAKSLADEIKVMPTERFDQLLAQEKHGTWTRNLLGIIEHHHYHLGQIVILKKITQPSNETIQ